MCLGQISSSCVYKRASLLLPHISKDLPRVIKITLFQNYPFSSIPKLKSLKKTVSLKSRHEILRITIILQIVQSQMGLACTQQLYIGFNSLAEHPRLLLVIWVHLDLCSSQSEDNQHHISPETWSSICNKTAIIQTLHVLKYPPLKDGYLEVIC